MIGSVLGWAALVILILAELNHAAKQIMKKRRKRLMVLSLVMGKQHGVWGGLLLVIGLLHGVLALVETAEATILVLGSGWVLFVCILFLTGTYLMRRKISHWLSCHKRLAVVCLVLAALHTIFVHI